MPLTRIGKLAEFPEGKLTPASVDGKRVFVVNINGQLHVGDARCTHVGGPLDEGTLEGKVVTCPWHGSKFDVTDGSVVGMPARTPIRVYSVSIQGDEVFVEV